MTEARRRPAAHQRVREMREKGCAPESGNRINVTCSLTRFECPTSTKGTWFTQDEVDVWNRRSDKYWYQTAFICWRIPVLLRTYCVRACVRACFDSLEGLWPRASGHDFRPATRILQIGPNILRRQSIPQCYMCQTFKAKPKKGHMRTYLL